jgi:prephenate dehydratase
VGEHSQIFYTLADARLDSPPRKMRSVAFLGPVGSFSHEVAINFANAIDATLVSQVTIKDVFDAVLRGSVTHGVVPIENSTNGSVTMTFDLFRDLKHGNLKVTGEEFLKVRHALLGNCPIKEVERIYSHPQVYYCPQVVAANVVKRRLDSANYGWTSI